jgi:serine/threonine protein kinase
MLDEYRIESILGAGGFGVTYKALDTHLDAWVAIKEYFPVEWSFRDPDGLTVHPNTQGDNSGSGGELSDYRWGLERFLDEARVLARIQHPYVVRVKRYFRAHGTAYIVMDYEEGQPLNQVLREGETLREDEVRGLLEDVLPALRAVHEQGYLHRDIKPSNLYIRASDHRVILIDFGAARQAAGRHSQSVTSLVTPGFSPPEQYTTRNDRYGAWTDIYALGAVLYRCITGHTPTEAADRLIDDTLEPAVKAGAGRYSTNLLRVIDQALAVRPDQRFLTVANMQTALAGAQDDDSDETVIMLPIKAAKSAPMLEAARITNVLAKSATEEASSDTLRTSDRSIRPLPAEPVEPDRSDWLNITQLPLSTRTASVERRQNAASGTTFRWRLTAFMVGGVVLTAVAALLIWLGLSEPSPPLASEPPPPPRYRLGQLEPVVEHPPPVTTETPASDATPSALSPTSDTTVDSPVLDNSIESTNSPTTGETPVVAGETAPATADSASASADSADLTVTGDGAEPVVTEETLEMPVAQDGASTAEGTELTAAEGPSETVESADMEEPIADAANAPVAPGIIPATITPKANTDTATASRDKRAAEQRAKTPRKTQRTRRTIRKASRPWKVIPYDQPVKQPSRLDSNKASPRNDRWGTPGGPGFNQK